jgi:hypothetical protein
MRDIWYADNRDLVKWSVLVELAARHGARHILQVLYYRPTQWADLEIDDQQVPLPASVLRHFRQATAICSLQSSARVEVIQDRFVDRTAYLAIVQQRIRARTELPGIVFLDPDTGLEPGTAGLEHVLTPELAAIWDVMPQGDVLVFYQHQTNRNNAPWVEPKKAQFELALNLPVGKAGLARGVRIAPDVVFFFAQKNDQRSPARPVVEDPRRVLAAHGPQEILDCLNRTRTRATYGAVAELIGGLARGVGQRLGMRRPEASWVVSAETGLPSGYAPREMHADLRGSPLVRTGDELRALLKRCKAG